MHAKDPSAVACIARLIGEAGRMQMLISLLDGDAHSASELAIAAGVSNQTATSHLAKLLGGGMVVAERSGRQRLFRLKNADVAAAVEAIGALANIHHYFAPMPEIRFARSCYDHLAGVLAIAVRDALLKRRAIRQPHREFVVTPVGEEILRSLEIDTAVLHCQRRSFAYACLDWTERSHHLGGSLGAALLSRFLDMGWVARRQGTRVLRLTHAGHLGFEKVFGIRGLAETKFRGVA
jgi:DNA-binding transcriptional ArsR family regulator